MVFTRMVCVRFLALFGVAAISSRSEGLFAATVSGMDAAPEPTRMYLRRVAANDPSEWRGKPHELRN